MAEITEICQLAMQQLLLTVDGGRRKPESWNYSDTTYVWLIFIRVAQSETK